MKKPLIGVWLVLYRLWLYAPLAFLIFQLLRATSFDSGGKGGLFPSIVIILACLALAVTVLFGKDFRQFDRVTPRRILMFFGFAILFVASLTLLLLFASMTSLVSPYLVTVPTVVALIFTPYMVILFDYSEPNLNTK